MAGERALPDLVSRIKVDSSGVDQAMTSLVTSFGKANLALAGVAAGIGLLVVGGKSMIDIAEKHEAAERSLAQAIESRNTATGKVVPDMTKVIKATEHLEQVTRSLSEFDVSHKGHKMTQIDLMHRQDAVQKVTDATLALSQAQADANKITQTSLINGQKLQSQLDDFIKTNRRYISSQSDVIDGAAKLVRSGLTQTEVEKDLSRALDLAALKHISFSEAVDLLNKAEQGRLKGLIDLGISTGKYTDAQGNLINGTKDVGRAMAEMDAKLKGGRDTLTDLQKNSNILSNDWQDLSQKGGPVLLTLLDSVVKAVTAIYDEFDKIGHDDQMWGAISDRLVKMASWIHQYILGPLGQVGEYISGAPIMPTLNSGSAANIHGGSATTGARQYGGPVIPGGIYTVGERGPETLVMGARGGMVIPNGGSRGGDTFNFHQVQTDPWEVANQIAWTKKTRRL